MASEIDLSELKRAVEQAKEMLADLKQKDIRKLKQRRITRALRKAHKLLNSNNYTQAQVDRVTRIVIRSMEDRMGIFWFYLIGVLVAGSLVFAGYETYSFIKINWDADHYFPIDSVSSLVTVNYRESNIVSLYKLFPVQNSIGLKNPKQEFNISNDTTKMPPGINYTVFYQINIVELNQNVPRIIDKKYLRYQITHYDAETGVKVSEKIGKFSDFPRNPDGTYKMFTGTQERGQKTNFEVVIWLGEDAPNKEQGRAYNFAFYVTAIVKTN